MTTIFDTSTIDAATDGVTTVNKSFLDGIVTDLEKGIYTASGDTYSVVSWDGSRSAHTWGQTTADKDLFLQRYSSEGVELKNTGNDEWRDIRLRHVAIASGTTPSTVATHGQLFVIDDTFKFMDTGGTVTELGEGTLPNIHLSTSGTEVDATNPPAISVTAHRYILSFDDSTDEKTYWTFRWPSWYAAQTVTLKAGYSMASATSGDVVWSAEVWAVSDGDAAEVDTESYDTANTVTDTVPGTAGYYTEASITMSNLDSVAAGDLVTIRFSRDADNGSDTASGDAELRTASLEFA